MKPKESADFGLLTPRSREICYSDRRIEATRGAPWPFTSGGRSVRNRARRADRPLGRSETYGFLERTVEGNVLVTVRDNNVDQALRALKKKMQREGVYREMKMRRSYEKPSEKRARERAEAVRRYRKLMRKRMEREGY